MKLLPFVKIIELNGGQFLIRKAYNIQEEKFELVLSLSVKDGPDINFTLSFINQVNRDNQYDDFTTEIAGQFLEKFEGFFLDNPTDEATVEMISREEPAIQQRPLIVVAGDEEYQQITKELSKHSHADQAQSPLIIMP